MRVLVTGGAGYVGSVLVPLLLERDYQVRVVDIGLFGTEHLPPETDIIIGDITDFEEAWLEGVDAVIQLAGISNDPMAEFSPRLNFLVNAGGTGIVGQAAKKVGIDRFIFASTCSIYGFTDNRELNEDCPVSPEFPYAISKLMAERALLCLADCHFKPIVLRAGTIVGWSPRMRYDLVVNTMVKSALTAGRIVVHNPRLWRPVIEVRDAAMAYVRALEADSNLSGIFNVAFDNFTIGRLAHEVAATLRQYNVRASIEAQDRSDARNYKVSTQKARDVLGFRPSISMSECVGTMMEHINLGDAADFGNPRYINVEWMKLRLAERVVSQDWSAVRTYAAS